MQVAIEVPADDITKQMQVVAAEAFANAAKRYQYAELLSIEDAAAFVGCTVTTFKAQFINAGLRVATFSPKLKRVRKTELLEFIKEHE
ncbi:hypothetical protein [Lacticaseibacillus sharpeae]|uniref:Uncharacterized protein n=1 Tax=Lacticaseibacillus sharpeae JCM 1186 = DSM 20505 TaxID=1291052 RepID=A0A0R1ZYM8_9LACO|nr:hypothetical protein [Lacticaseibacillus sharpeae]KRM56227.1 hypothetical protein FC18_GL000205 [Lacticaseibacillus sharpeae JCM 1186 = DSM 20505]